MRCSLRDQKQFSGGCTACHRGMGAGGVGKAIGFADRHRDRSVLDPVEKLLGAIEKEFVRVDVVHERCVADLDALRRFMISSGPGPPSTGPYQQKVPDRRSASIDPLKVLGPEPS